MCPVPKRLPGLRVPPAAVSGRTLAWQNSGCAIQTYIAKACLNEKSTSNSNALLTLNEDANPAPSE